MAEPRTPHAVAAAPGHRAPVGVHAWGSHRWHPPHDVEAAEQARAGGRTPHDGDVEVKGDGHGPEEGAGVGEGGEGALQHAVP